MGADALSRVFVTRHDQIVGSRTVAESWQLSEYATTAIVEQYDTKIAAQVGVPKGVLVVEEAQVAYHTNSHVVRCERESGSR